MTSESAIENIRRFRSDRVGAIQRNEAPVHLPSEGVMAFHLIPLSAFTGSSELPRVDFDPGEKRKSILPLLRSDRALARKANPDGDPSFPLETAVGYMHTFTGGISENVSVFAHGPDPSRGHTRTILPFARYEKTILNFMGKYIWYARKIDVPPPYYAFLSFVGVRGYVFDANAGYRDSFHPEVSPPPIEEDVLEFPETVIEEEEENNRPGKILKPVFDAVWNAFGYPQSRNYNQYGDWIAPR